MKQNSRVLKSFLIIALALSITSLFTSQAKAEDSEKEHPCAEYVKHCKAQDLTPGHGLWKCVAKEARKSKNEVCMAKLKEGAMKMRERREHKAETEKSAE